jgi:hypothetical protein
MILVNLLRGCAGREFIEGLGAINHGGVEST